MTANESITHAEPIGRDEAAEVLARELYEARTGIGPFDDLPKGFKAPLIREANDVLAALSPAGFLATEQEWAIQYEFDREVYDSEREARTRFERMRPNTKATLVSRRVTAWTEVDA